MPDSGSSFDSEASVELIRRARSGDKQATAKLTERYITPFRRWASGRLPRWARGALDTDDIVQDTVMHTLNRLPEFQDRGEGALLAYMRTALRNRIRQELRNHARRGRDATLDSKVPDEGPSPLMTTVTQESLERYEHALEQLPEAQRQAIVGRIELGMSWEEVAAIAGMSSADSARMAVGRALRKLAEGMARGA